MEDLNIKLLSALKSLMPFIDADIDRGIRNDNRHGGLEYRARNAKAVILEAEHTIAAAEQAQQAKPVLALAGSLGVAADDSAEFAKFTAWTQEDGPISPWDAWKARADIAHAQPPAVAVPDEIECDGAPWMSADTEPDIAYRDGWNACRAAMLAAAPQGATAGCGACGDGCQGQGCRLERESPPTCQTCNGHGMIGGLLPNGGGYDGQPCPDCAAQKGGA